MSKKHEFAISTAHETLAVAAYALSLAVAVSWVHRFTRENEKKDFPTMPDAHLYPDIIKKHEVLGWTYVGVVETPDSLQEQ